MKKITLILMLFAIGFAHAQIVNIPDYDFKDSLINSNCVDSDLDGIYDTDADLNNDGEIQLSEAQSIVSLNLEMQDIQSISGIENFTNLEILNCANNFFNTIDLTALNALRYLNIGGNLLTALNVNSNVNLEDLNCSQNEISSLNVNLNLNLENLNCSSNNLSTINVSTHPNLRTLVCDNMFSLNTLNVSQCPNLNSVNCEFSSISNLNASSNPNLEFLYCFSNGISSLNLNQTPLLKVLHCYDNNIANLDVTTSPLLVDLESRFNNISTLNLSQNLQLERLILNYNALSTIDITQNLELNYLSIGNNSLISNVDLSQNINLLYFSCGNTELSSLDVTQNINLEDIRVSFNQLTSLDFSQNPNLKYLYANDNLITTLDLNENPNLLTIRVDDNDLTSLFLKNGNQETSNLTFEGNDDLEYICTDESDMFIVDLRLNSYGYSNTIINTYCSFEPGGDFNIITGNIIFDINDDGCDPTDQPQPHFKIDMNDGIDQESTFTGANGTYFFYTLDGDFELSPNLEEPNWFNVSPISATIPFTNSNNNLTTQDFCVTANGIHNDVEIAILPEEAAQPGFDAIYKIVFKNKGNQMVSGDLNVTFDDTVLDFISASIAPDNQTVNNLSWNYNNLLPFERRSIKFTLNVNSPMETPAVNNGDVLNFNATITPDADDETPLNNSFDYDQTVVGSYDPNDITCLEGATVSPDDIGKYLHYNINFENTGTAAASFIVVRDEINVAEFDINSLQVLYSSHAVTTRINAQVIEFIFDNINLPAEGKGNVLFKIKTKSDLVLGNSVANKADIYFDYNFPIETNTATTVFDVLSVETFEQGHFNVYPNPVTDVLNVTSNTILIHFISIYDIHGRLVKKQFVNKNQLNINSSELQSGIYILIIKTKHGGEERIKLIKN